MMCRLDFVGVCCNAAHGMLVCAQRADAAEAQQQAAQGKQAELQQRVAELTAALEASQQKEVELSDSLILLNERADRAASASPSPEPGLEAHTAALSARLHSLVRAGSAFTC